ncbi:e3 ubiquitin-protein ligase RNF13 [Trichonephila clavipes]|nr:e3 ubiquitin-protein ligase RNF13 [Trichonephila clavipes]
MAPHTITPAVGTGCRCKAKAGLRRSPWGLHTRTRLSSLLRLNLDSSLKPPGSIPLQSSFLVRGTTPNGDVDGWMSRTAHVMGAGIPNVLQPGTFVWFEKTQGPLLKLLVPGWRPMKQLAVRVHFLRCSGLLDDWSVKGILSLVFVQIASLGSTDPNTSSQHNQSGLIDELS